MYYAERALIEDEPAARCPIRRYANRTSCGLAPARQAVAQGASLRA